MTKILLLLKTNSFSGAENVAVSICKGFSDDKEYECIYCAVKGPIEDNLKAANISYYLMDNFDKSNLKKAIKEIHPDLIHANDFTCSIYAKSLFPNIPCISHIHNNPLWIRKFGLKTFMYNRYIKKFEKILTVSNAINEEFWNYKLKDATVVGNPLSRDMIINKVGDVEHPIKYDIVFIGRLEEQKDPLRFVRLVSKIVKDFPNIRTCMMGDGSLKQEVKKLITDKKLKDNIHLLGFVENPINILNSSKILLFPSRWEGFGLVAFESISLGKPVVASNVGGISQMINDECGFLCNDDDDFEEAIKKLMDSNIYKIYSANALIRSKNIENYKDYCKNLSTIYHDILIKRKKSV